jgi:hypothetical protein
LFFNADGTIRKVIPTLRGVGITKASQKIEIDRYSAISESGTLVELMDTSYTFKGWKTMLDTRNAWIRYNAVNFGNDKLKSVQINAISQTGGTLQIHLDKADGPLLAEVKIPRCTNWTLLDAKVRKMQPGNHNLVVVSTEENPVEIDWIRFIK